MASTIIKFKGSSENEKDFCLKAGYYYTKADTTSIGGQKCDNCVDEYKIPYSFDENGNIKNLGKCLGSNKCDNTYPYYTQDKICHQKCNYKELVNINSPNDVASKNANCVIKCNVSGYQYESSDGTKCYNECPSSEPFYY